MYAALEEKVLEGGVFLFVSWHEKIPGCYQSGNLSHLLFVNTLTFAFIDGLVCIGGIHNNFR